MVHINILSSLKYWYRGWSQKQKQTVCDRKTKKTDVLYVGVGRTEFKRVEMREKIMDVIGHSKQSASLNHEAVTLQGGGSSHKIYNYLYQNKPFLGKSNPFFLNT